MSANFVNKNILDHEVPDYLKVKIPTGISFVDQMADGGFVPSTTALLSGEPGAGKSTLMAQIADALTGKDCIVLYNSVEQTADQISSLAEKLGLVNGFYFEKYNDLKKIIAHVITLQIANPDKYIFLIIDSISALADGSRAEAGRAVKTLTEFCQQIKCIGLFIIHLTKGGEFAGNNSMLHEVDAYYHMKVSNTDEDDGVRTLTVRKNRFGKKKVVATVLTSSGHVDPALIFSGEPAKEIVDEFEDILDDNIDDSVTDSYKEI